MRLTIPIAVIMLLGVIGCGAAPAGKTLGDPTEPGVQIQPLHRGDTIGIEYVDDTAHQVGCWVITAYSAVAIDCLPFGEFIRR